MRAASFVRVPSSRRSLILNRTLNLEPRREALSAAIERLERLERINPVMSGGSLLQPWAETQCVRTQDVDLGLLGDFLLLDIGDAVGPAGPAVGVVSGEEEEVVA